MWPTACPPLVHERIHHLSDNYRGVALQLPRAVSSARLKNLLGCKLVLPCSQKAVFLWFNRALSLCLPVDKRIPRAFGVVCGAGLNSAFNNVRLLTPLRDPVLQLEAHEGAGRIA